MSNDYSYDENGQFFPFFIFTITGLITIPVTYSLLKPSKQLENTAPRISSDFRPEHADLIEGARRKQKRRERKLKRGLFAIAGWATMAFMVYLIIVTQRTTPKIYDPFEILGISHNADQKQIKSKYRKLSLTQHPDKVRLDASKNETVETVNERWVEITKAFKALTDEEIRQNWLQYGNPDGKQGFSIGIALPKFIVAEGSGRYVLGLYGLVLGMLLPYLVGKWWYGQQRVTKEKVLVSSAGKLFKEYEDGAKEGGLVGVVSSGDEYKDLLKGDKAESGLAKVEQRVLRESDTSPFAAGLDVKDSKKLQDMDEGVRRKALGLIWAYLGRVDLEDQTLNDEKFEIAPTALVLNEAYANIALAYANTAPLLSSYHLSQCLIQAIPPNGSPLLQLPYFTPTIAKAIEGEESRKHLTIQEYMRLPSSERKSRSIGPGKLTQQQYDSVIAFANKLPILHLDKAYFKVVGEKFITQSSLVSFMLKGRIISAATTSLPPVSENDLEDVDPSEGDLAAIKKEQKEAEKATVQPPLAHAPYFARDHSPRWHVFLADSKQGKIAVPPTTFSTFDKPIFDERGEFTGNVQTLKMQFGAPPQAGRYTFVMHLVCDSYVGMDVKREVTLVVEDSSKAEVVIEDEEPSDPEEGTFAGQLGAMKGQKVKKAQIEDEDESDTEGEEESQSETDTETEDEGE